MLDDALTAMGATATLNPTAKNIDQATTTVKFSLLVAVLVSSIAPAASSQQRATRLETLALTPTEYGLVAVLQGDGALEHRVVQEQNPSQRLILDVLGVQNPLRHYYPAESDPFLDRILMYEYPEATNPNRSGPLARVVFELKQGVAYETRSVGDEIHVSFWEVGTSPEAQDSLEPVTIPDVPMELDADPADLFATHETAAEADSTDETEPDPSVPDNVSIEPDDIPASVFFHPSSTTSEDYRLGPEDVIEVRVFELDQLNRKVRVSGDGRVELPLVGSLQVAGMTNEEVAAAVADKLRNRYVQNPQVSIFILEFNSRKVSLLGAVQSPSTYPLTGQRRLLQVLAEAGSLSPDAGTTLYVFRQTQDGRSARLTVPLNELLLQGDPRWNIVLVPGDVVSVPPEQAIAVSVLGAVNAPGVHKLPVGDEATLLKAIALAGGLNERASKKGIQVKRRDSDGQETIIKVNLGDVLSGKKPDVVLVEGDVVVVNESFF